MGEKKNKQTIFFSSLFYWMHWLLIFLFNFCKANKTFINFYNEKKKQSGTHCIFGGCVSAWKMICFFFCVNSKKKQTVLDGHFSETKNKSRFLHYKSKTEWKTVVEPAKWIFRAWFNTYSCSFCCAKRPENALEISIKPIFDLKKWFCRVLFIPNRLSLPQNVSARFTCQSMLQTGI